MRELYSPREAESLCSKTVVWSELRVGPRAERRGPDPLKIRKALRELLPELVCFNFTQTYTEEFLSQSSRWGWPPQRPAMIQGSRERNCFYLSYFLLKSQGGYKWWSFNILGSSSFSSDCLAGWPPGPSAHAPCSHLVSMYFYLEMYSKFWFPRWPDSMKNNIVFWKKKYLCEFIDVLAHMNNFPCPGRNLSLLKSLLFVFAFT